MSYDGCLASPKQFLQFAESSSPALPSDKKGYLKTVAPGLDEEQAGTPYKLRCPSKYGVTVQAQLKSGSTVTNTLTCHVYIDVLDRNEEPRIIAATLTAPRSVNEGSLPGTSIGSLNLAANDPEADRGVQQLTWEVTKCVGIKPNGEGSVDLKLPTDVSASSKPQCPIKVSACDGEISVAEASTIDYETHIEYRLTVKVTDDGTPAYSDASAADALVIKVNPSNDPPSIEAVQELTISENPVAGQAANKPLTATDVDNTLAELRFYAVDKTEDEVCAASVVIFLGGWGGDGAFFSFLVWGTGLFDILLGRFYLAHRSSLIPFCPLLPSCLTAILPHCLTASLPPCLTALPTYRFTAFFLP